MMTPKMKEDFCTQILGASRQLFLSGRISEICREKGTQKQLEFILELLQAELTLRDENRRKRLIKRAGFPTYKTFEGYSYHCVKFPPAFSREELETLEFVPGKKNLVLYGPVGIGKTHMAIAAGVKACNLGYKTKFYTVTELVLKLAESRKNGTLERLLRDLRSLDLLILDEWGYVPVDKDGSQLLFRVISDSYESKSLILTTNLEFSKCITDITEIPARNGKLYVSAIFDCFDLSVLGLSMGTNMKADLCIQTLENALTAYPALEGAIIHSDRGTQYTSESYRQTIREHHIHQSMNSAGGRCHDNARCESMWARMKTELLYDRYDTKQMTVEELKVLIWRYFLSYWNNRRICSANGGLPPMIKRRQYYETLELAA